MAHYADDCPANETTVCYRRGGNLHQEITLLSLKSTLVRSFQGTFILRLLCANFLLCYMIISYSMFPLTKHCHNL